MDYYFFLDTGRFDPVITVSSFPPSDTKIIKDENGLYVCYAYPQEGFWSVSTYAPIPNASSMTVHWASLGLERHVIPTTLVFLSRKPLSGKYQTIPADPTLTSVPSWRANLQILGNGTSTSYQGEYPHAMMKIKGGSIVSLVPFIQRFPDAKNYLLYASFEESAIHREGVTDFIDVKKKEKLVSFPVKSNQVNCLDVSDLDVQDGQLLISVNQIMGIPVFFTTDESGVQMSLEHTMTPSEYSIFGEQDVRRGVMRKMKEYWSNSI